MIEVILLPLLAGLFQHTALADDPQGILLSEDLCTNDEKKIGRLGIRACDAVRADVKKNLLWQVRQMISGIYEGKLYDPNFALDAKQLPFCLQTDASGAALTVKTPICNVADPLKPESDKNWKNESCIAADSKSGPDADGFCDFKTLGSTSLNFDQLCPKEMSWIRGIRSQIWQNKLAEVLRELHDKNKIVLTRHEVNGNEVVPCKDLGAELSRLTYGDPQFLGLLPLKEQLETINASLSPNAKFDEYQSCSADAFSTTKLGVVANSQMSLVGCDLIYARRYSEFVLSRLAMCEVSSRAKKLYYDSFFSSDDLFKAIMNDVLLPCKQYALSKKPPGSQPTSFWEDPGLRSDFYKCYKTGQGVTGSKGVEDYLREKIREAIPVNDADGLYPFKQKEDLSITQNCALSLVPALGARRRKKKSKARAWLSVLVVAIFLMLGSHDAQAFVDGSMTCPDGKSVEVKPDPKCVLAAQQKACRAKKEIECKGQEDKAQESINQGNGDPKCTSFPIPASCEDNDIKAAEKPYKDIMDQPMNSDNQGAIVDASLCMMKKFLAYQSKCLNDLFCSKSRGPGNKAPPSYFDSNMATSCGNSGTGGSITITNIPDYKMDPKILNDELQACTEKAIAANGSKGCPPGPGPNINAGGQSEMNAKTEGEKAIVDGADLIKKNALFSNLLKSASQNAATASIGGPSSGAKKKLESSGPAAEAHSGAGGKPQSGGVGANTKTNSGFEGALSLDDKKADESSENAATAANAPKADENGYGSAGAVAGAGSRRITSTSDGGDVTASSNPNWRPDGAAGPAGKDAGSADKDGLSASKDSIFQIVNRRYDTHTKDMLKTVLY